MGAGDFQRTSAARVRFGSIVLKNSFRRSLEPVSEQRDCSGWARSNASSSGNGLMTPENLMKRVAKEFFNSIGRKQTSRSVGEDATNSLPAWRLLPWLSDPRQTFGQEAKADNVLRHDA